MYSPPCSGHRKKKEEDSDFDFGTLGGGKGITSTFRTRERKTISFVYLGKEETNKLGGLKEKGRYLQSGKEK